MQIIYVHKFSTSLTLLTVTDFLLMEPACMLTVTHRFSRDAFNSFEFLDQLNDY